MARYMDTDMAAARAAPIPGAAPNLLRWGAVFGGVVLGLSLLLLLTVLWMALAFGGEIEAMQENLEWWTAGSAIVAMFVGGLLAGWLSGVPGAGAGFFNGLAVWGLILIASLVIGVPGALQALNLDALGISGAEVDLAGQAGPLWAAFFSLLVGALAAGVGGAIGGALTRPAFAPAGVRISDRERHDDRYEDEYRVRDRDADRYREPTAPTRAGERYDRDYAGEPGPERFSDRPPREDSTIDMREEEAGPRREP